MRNGFTLDNPAIFRSVAVPATATCQRETPLDPARLVGRVAPRAPRTLRKPIGLEKSPRNICPVAAG
jgi:hypothetical protein